MNLRRRLKVIWEILIFPFEMLYNPFRARRVFDRYIDKYYSLGLHKLFNRLSFRIYRRFQHQKGLKINIVSGDGWYYQDWIGIDYKGAYPYKSKGGERGFGLNWNVLRGLPFKSNSVAMIYCSHFLEHLTYNESVRFLTECHRILEEGGKIRIVVPDADLFIAKLLERDEGFFRNEKIAGGKWLGNITDTFLMNFYSAPGWNNHCHKYAYKFENLAFRLKETGFKNIVRNSYMDSQWKEFNLKAFNNSNSKVPFFHFMSKR